MLRDSLNIKILSQIQTTHPPESKIRINFYGNGYLQIKQIFIGLFTFT